MSSKLTKSGLLVDLVSDRKNKTDFLSFWFAVP